MQKHNQIASLLFSATHRPGSIHLSGQSPPTRAVTTLERELWLKLARLLLYNLEQKVQDALWNRDYENK